MRSIYSFEIYIVRFEESSGAKILKEIMIILKCKMICKMKRKRNELKKSNVFLKVSYY